MAKVSFSIIFFSLQLLSSLFFFFSFWFAGVFAVPLPREGKTPPSLRGGKRLKAKFRDSKIRKRASFIKHSLREFSLYLGSLQRSLVRSLMKLITWWSLYAFFGLCFFGGRGMRGKRENLFFLLHTFSFWCRRAPLCGKKFSRVGLLLTTIFKTTN